MFVNTVPEHTQRGLALLAKGDVTASFYLAGGTAVALHLGHRVSLDLDFYSQVSFDALALEGRMQSIGTYRRERVAEDTLLAEFEGTRLSFFRWSYPLLDEPVAEFGVKIAGLRDLAAMKLEAIAGRNTRRDFIDLYFIAQAGIPPKMAFELYQQKFAGLNLNVVHVAKSLGVFQEAEADVMPRMLKKMSWKDVRRYFEKESAALLRGLVEP